MMRLQERDDAARAAGFSSYAEFEERAAKGVPTDELSYDIHRIADEMCRCEDLKCSREVLANYQNKVSRGTPSDELARRSIATDSDRLAACLARYE